METVEDPPFIPECEVFYEGGPDSKDLYEGCKKNPGHKSFIPVKEFKMEHLPPDQQTKEVMDAIKIMCTTTVKVNAKYTSPKRPDTYPKCRAPYPYRQLKGKNSVSRYGTGYIHNHLLYNKPRDGQCPCHLCKASDHPETGYLEVLVNTAAHVIVDDAEAERAEFELFYDSEDKEGVKVLYGLELYGSGSLDWRCTSDQVRIKCATHDKELMKMLLEMPTSTICKPGQGDGKLGLIVSHPHGRSKQITIGKMLEEVPEAHKVVDDVIFFKPGTKCRLGENSTSNESFQRFVGSDTPCQPGVEYTLKQQRMALPSSNHMPSKQLEDSGNSQKDLWISLPSGSKFPDGGTGESFSLPDVEFLVDQRYNNMLDDSARPYTYYMTYDIDTCPGASGARVRNAPSTANFFLFIDYHFHCGSLRNGANRSSVQSIPQKLALKRVINMEM